MGARNFPKGALKVKKGKGTEKNSQSQKGRTVLRIVKKIEQTTQPRNKAPKRGTPKKEKKIREKVRRCQGTSLKTWGIILSPRKDGKTAGQSAGGGGGGGERSGGGGRPAIPSRSFLGALLGRIFI